MSPARARFGVCLVALLGVLALGAGLAPRLSLADGVPLRRPIDLTRAGLTRLVVEQPVDTILVMELSFLAPRGEWRDGLAFEYALIVRDAGGTVLTTKRGGELNARLGGGTPGRGDVEAVAWLSSFRAARDAEYDLALEVVRPVAHPRAAKAELAIVPIARTAFARLGRWALIALWCAAVVVLGGVLVRLWPAARRGPG